MPLTRVTLRDLPRPSDRAHPDADWHQLTPLAWQALADPASVSLWPDASSAVEPWCSFASALELLAYGTGWTRLDLGTRAWREQGYGPISPVLTLVGEILADRLDELTAWLCTSELAGHVEVSIGHAVGVSPPGLRREAPAWALDLVQRLEGTDEQDPISGGTDPLHLSSHATAPIDDASTPGTVYLAPDAHPPEAALHLASYRGWYRELARVGDALPPDPSGRSWRVSVVCEPVGHLGTFRRSRVSGRWFRDRHGIHEMGAPRG